MTGAARVSTGPANLLAEQEILSYTGGSMFGALLFIACVVLQFHFHDAIPWYIWVAALIGLCVSFGEPAMKIRKE
jgi:ABC-type Fe3+-siderophore transport system permease subunit